MTDSKIEALKAYVLSQGWQFGPSKPIQYGEQIVVASASYKATINYYPKNGNLVLGGPSSPLRDNLQDWIKHAKHVNASTLTDAQHLSPNTARPIAEFSVREKPQNLPVTVEGSHIGMDESGKGDWFGPLVIAAVFIDEQTARKLRSIGVRDSKTLTGDTILRLASQIKDLIPANHRHVLALSPILYNQKYDRFKNISLLLADAYAQVAFEVWRHTHTAVIVCDQFSQNTDRLNSTFAAKQLPKPTQQHHAEFASLAVAAASILASAAFTEALADLGKVAGTNTPLPKGASELAKLEVAAQQIIKYHGPEALGQYAKLHFKPIQTLLQEQRKQSVEVPTHQGNTGQYITVEQREWRMQCFPRAFWRFSFRDGGILDWYADSTGKLDVRGKSDARSYQKLLKIAHGRTFGPGITAEETAHRLERMKERLEELFPSLWIDIPPVPGIGWKRQETLLGSRFDFTDGGVLQYYHGTDTLLIQGAPSQSARAALEKLPNPFWSGLDTLTDNLRSLFPDWRLGNEAAQTNDLGSWQPRPIEDGIDWRPFWPKNRKKRPAANGRGPCQQSLIEDWSSVLVHHSNRRHLLAHAPTGLGKTISALVPALAWVAIAPDRRRIYYLVNRVNQHDNPLRELKASLAADFANQTGEQLRVVDLVGRRVLCRYPDAANLDDFCKRSRNTASFNQLPSPVSTWREVQSHLGNRACPYHTLQGLMAGAHVVICDYWWLFSESGRTQLAGFSSDDSIVIVDEAHNLPVRVRDELSIDEPVDNIERAILQAPDLARPHLETIVEEVRKIPSGEGVSPLWFTQRVGGTQTVQATLDILKARGSIEGHVPVLERLLRLLLQSDEAAVAYLEDDGVNPIKLIFRLVDPTPILRSGYNNAYASLSMSGTLAAPSDDSSELSYQVPLFGLTLSETLTRKYASPFPSNNRRWVYCPDTLGTFKEREKYLDTYAKHIVAIGQRTPGVTAVFFSSYPFLEMVRERVVKHIKQEMVISEQRADAESPDARLASLSDYEQRLREFIHEKERVFLFAVYQGKLAEGADFNGNLIKTVICVSVPIEYSQLYHERLQNLYQRLFESIAKERGDSLREKAWEYALHRVSLSQVLQACGRGIRSEDDRCAFVLLDQRYGDGNKGYRWRRFLEPRPYNLTHPERTVVSFHSTSQTRDEEKWDKVLLSFSIKGEA